MQFTHLSRCVCVFVLLWCVRLVSLASPSLSLSPLHFVMRLGGGLLLSLVALFLLLAPLVAAQSCRQCCEGYNCDNGGNCTKHTGRTAVGGIRSRHEIGQRFDSSAAASLCLSCAGGNNCPGCNCNYGVSAHATARALAVRSSVVASHLRSRCLSPCAAR